MTDDLRVALVTTHLPLKDVAAAITDEAVALRCVSRMMHCKHSLVLNSHISVQGSTPCRRRRSFRHGRNRSHSSCHRSPACRRLKINRTLPADTIFQPKYMQAADSIVACITTKGCLCSSRMDLAKQSISRLGSLILERLLIMAQHLALLAALRQIVAVLNKRLYKL